MRLFRSTLRPIANPGWHPVHLLSFASWDPTGQRLLLAISVSATDIYGCSQGKALTDRQEKREFKRRAASEAALKANKEAAAGSSPNKPRLNLKVSLLLAQSLRFPDQCPRHGVRTVTCAKCFSFFQGPYT